MEQGVEGSGKILYVRTASNLSRFSPIFSEIKGGDFKLLCWKMEVARRKEKEEKKANSCGQCVLYKNFYFKMKIMKLFLLIYFNERFVFVRIF